MTAELVQQSLSTAAEHLRRPFAADALGWKIAPERGENAAVCFIDRGLVIDRLNVVVPHLWSDDYEQLAQAQFMECALTIDGATRKDVGQARKLKARYSDAFKRAAVKFGIGAYLMRVPVVLLEDGEFDGDRVNGKGLERCRTAYTGWLGDAGSVFGEVLEHGDAGDAQGDPEDIDDDESGGVEGSPYRSHSVALQDQVASLLEGGPKEGLGPIAIAEALHAREGDVLTVLAELVGTGAAIQMRNRYFARRDA